MTDAPTPAELLEAARLHLRDEVLEHVDSAHRYGLRLALQALMIAEREIRRNPPDPRGVAAFADLGHDGAASLAAAIRDGREDHRWDAVVEAVRAEVTDRLLVTNPDYLTRSR